MEMNCLFCLAVQAFLQQEDLAQTVTSKVGAQWCLEFLRPGLAPVFPPPLATGHVPFCATDKWDFKGDNRDWWPWMRNSYCDIEA